MPRSNFLEVQKHFVIPSPSGLFGFQGYIDLWLPTGGMPGIDGTLPVVSDFKTTGNWKYAKTKEQLEKDVQAQLYAKWALVTMRTQAVDLAWVYFATKGPRKAKRVHLRVLASHVEEQFSAINATAVEMYAIRKAKLDPLELKPNPEMCGAFGGCPYQDKCSLGPSEFIDARAAEWRQRADKEMSNTPVNTMSLLQRLKAQKEAATTGATKLSFEPATEQDKAEASARVAALIADSNEALGFNPPEKDLPPAPAVGVTVSSEGVADTATKTKRTYTKRTPKDPIAADAIAHSTPPEAAVTIEESPPIDFETNVIDVTWGQETFCPVPYNPIVVGPFAISGTRRSGESLADAQSRLYAELVVFAEERRAEKLVSFKKTLDAIGGGR